VNDEADPGWGQALRKMGWTIIPFLGLVTGRRWARGLGGLTIIRTVFLSLIVSNLVFLEAFRFVVPWDGGDEKWVPWGVTALSCWALLGLELLRRRTALSIESETSLATAYRARFFIGVGLAESAPLSGLAATFIAGSLWVYLIGLAFGFVGLWRIAPSQRNLSREQAHLREQGSSLSLVAALNAQPMPPPTFF
jgi:hypothetical protein